MRGKIDKNSFQFYRLGGNHRRMSPNREQIKKLLAQGRHQRALDALLDLLGEHPPVHDVHFAAGLIAKQIDTAQLGFKPLRVGILRSFTLELIEPFMITACARLTLTPQFYFAPYNVIHQEVIDSNSPLHRFNPQIVILAARLHELSPKLIWQFPSLSDQRIEQLSEEALQDMAQIISALSKHSRYQVIVHNFAGPARPAMGVIESQLPTGQRLLIRRMNEQLHRLAQDYPNVYILDFDQVRARIGYDRFDDLRGWYLGRSPICSAGLAELAKEYAAFIRPLISKTKKCLILDLDNTLWGGIIGEDGLEGIKLGGDYPGNAFAEFQQALLNLYHRGVILAVASKNNKADALEVFQKHPEMILRQEHFASMHINWQDKVQSIRTIAAELNIGTDSMVFMDDSDFECELVRQELPEVLTLKLPGEPAKLRGKLESLDCFDLLGYTAEDRARGRQYRQQVQRSKARAESASLEDFYRSLQIKLLIGPPQPGQLNRIVQMTQKTNQFNLTTRRYQATDIKAMLDSPDTFVYALRYADRFGDAGLVGLAIVRTRAKDWLIDSLLLSCRVIGRTVEQALLVYLARQARQAGVQRLIGEYIPTAKNVLVKDFYSSRGFEQIAAHDGPIQFRGNLDKLPADYADYLQVEEC